MNNNLGNKRFESHASYMTNNRLALLFGQVDMLAPRAWSTMRLSDIKAYFHTVDQILKSVKDVLDNSDDVGKFRKKYIFLMNLINSDERYRSFKALQTLLELTDEMYSVIITGMQSWSYFFRVGSYQKKGLKNIQFFNDSIFGGGATNGGDTESNTLNEESKENSQES